MGVNVITLKDGYSRMDGGVMYSNSTSTLIKDSHGQHIIVDVLTAWDQHVMLEALKKEGFHPDDIKYVVCTHGHSDHVGLLSLFTKAIWHIVGYSIHNHDKYFIHPFDQQVDYDICDKVKVIPTPGHTADDVSVVVDSGELGTVVVAGDLFECKEDLKDPTIWKDRAGSTNPDQQLKNRKIVLNMADYIIPGHGVMFKVTQDLKNLL